jgi:outer membrane protein insertion porin family
VCDSSGSGRRRTPRPIAAVPITIAGRSAPAIVRARFGRRISGAVVESLRLDRLIKEARVSLRPTSRCAAVLFGLLLAALQTTPARAQTEVADGTVVGQVELQGLQAVGEGYVRRILKTRAGQGYALTLVQEDVRELLRTRKFIAVSADARLGSDGRAIVTFNLQEKQSIQGLEIDGNRIYDDAELFGLLGFAAGDPLDTFEVGRGRENILQKYKEGGYYYADVQLDQSLLDAENRVLYRVSEGARVKVREIRFEGVTAFPEPQLRFKVQTETYFWILRTGAFDEQTAERDALELQQFYRSEGYLDARVGYRLDFDAAERTDLNVVFVVEEGTPYKVNSIQYAGNEAFQTDLLSPLVKLTAGDVAGEERIRLSAEAIRDAYGEIGYVDVRVDPQIDYLEEPGLVDLTFQVQEGARARIGRITIRGNATTKDEVVRRELRFYPGEDFDTVEARAAEKRLTETTLFSKATITPLEDDAGVREALVEVEEGRVIDFLIGAAVSTDSGLIGSFTISNRNFDLFDWPRTFGQLFRGRAFRGDGQRLRFTAEPGSETSRFRIDFTEPYFLDKPLRFDTGVYLFTRERDGYDEQRLGFTVALGRRFESGLLNGWAVEGALRFENIEIDDLDPLVADDIYDVRGNNFLTSVKGTIVRDTTDSRLVPTQGDRFSLAWEQVGALGGDADFGRPSLGYTWYKTLRTDVLDRKSVLALRLDSGLIVGDAPVFERYYGGGFGSIRGFDYRGVSPRAGLFNNRVGGDFILLTGAEYSFPLYAEAVRGVTFLDMGTVEESVTINSWRAAIGAGIRINVPFFGPVPIVLDFAWPLAEEDEDDTRVFNFSFGASF